MPRSSFRPFRRWCGLLWPALAACASPEADRGMRPRAPLAGAWRHDSVGTRFYDAPGHLATSSVDRLGGPWVRLDTTVWWGADGEALPMTRHGDTLWVVRPASAAYAPDEPLVEKYAIQALNERHVVLRNTWTAASTDGPLVWVTDHYYSR